MVFRHAGPEEPAPYLIRGHPETLKRLDSGVLYFVNGFFLFL